MMNSPVEKIKNKNLDLHWDKKEQTYLEKKQFVETDSNTKRDVQDYLNFLSDFTPSYFKATKEKTADIQFTF